MPAKYMYIFHTFYEWNILKFYKPTEFWPIYSLETCQLTASDEDGGEASVLCGREYSLEL